MKFRGYPRYRVRFHSSFSSAEIVAGEGVGLDLSVRGCRISCPTRVTRGTELQLHLILPENDHYSSVDVERGVVQWTEGDEFGVEFLQLTTEVSERIHRFVRTLVTEQGQ
ncbi:MAG: PilZ domain-containing protein [Nitrospiraceae bacterium]